MFEIQMTKTKSLEFEIVSNFDIRILDFLFSVRTI